MSLEDGMLFIIKVHQLKTVLSGISSPFISTLNAIFIHTRIQYRHEWLVIQIGIFW